MQRNRTAWLTLVLLALVGAVSAGPMQAETSDREGVAEATAQFYTALNALFTGDVEPMKAIWSHADDVTYMGPDGGFQVGWSAVLANWQVQAGKKLGGKIRPSNMHMKIGRDLAITQCYEKGENTNAVDGKPQKVSIRATNIFRKEGGTWKMIGHHTDTLSFLD